MFTKEQEELISRYGDPDLSPAERALLDELVQSEPQARQLLDQYRRLDDALAKLPDKLDEVDLDGFAERVGLALDDVQGSKYSNGSKLRQEQPGRLWFRRLVRRALVPLAAAAAIVIVVLPWLMSGPEKVSLPHQRQVVILHSGPTRGQSFVMVRMSQPPIEQSRQSIRTVLVAALEVAGEQPVEDSASQESTGPGEIICWSGGKIDSGREGQDWSKDDFFGFF